MVKLFTDSAGLDLYNSNLFFFGEDAPLTGESNLFIIEIEDSVLTQIQSEKDGVKIYKVFPSQVIKFGY